MLRTLIISACLLMARGVMGQDASAYYMVLEDAIVYNYLIAEDFSGNGNDGTCSSTNILTLVAGGWDADFDGAGEHILTGDIPAGMTAFTESIWINGRDIANSGSFSGINNPASAVSANLLYSASGGDVVFIVYFNNTGSNFDQYRSVIALSDDTWYHIVATWNSSHEMSIFVNGSSIPGTYFTGGTKPTQIDQGTLYIGARQPTPVTFNGFIADTRIYSTVLGSNDIDTLYNGTRHAPVDVIDDTNLEGFWNMQPKEL